MTCRDCELLLAQDELAVEVSAHLAECAECRALAGELNANSMALGAMRVDEIAPVVFRRPLASRPWVWSIAAAAALVLAVSLVERQDRPRISVPPEVVRIEAPEIDPLPMLPPVVRSAPGPRTTRPRPQASKPRVEPVLMAAVKPEPLLVKILTPDPDVVIYWLIEPEEGNTL